MTSDRDLGLLAAKERLFPNHKVFLCETSCQEFKENVLCCKCYEKVFESGKYIDIKEFDTLMIETKSCNIEFYNKCVVSDVRSWANSKCTRSSITTLYLMQKNPYIQQYEFFLTRDITNFIILLNNYAMNVFFPKKKSEI